MRVDGLCLLNTYVTLVDLGIFLLNLVCRDQRIRSDVMSILREAFETVQVTKIKNEVNEIVKCCSSISPLKTEVSDAK